MNKQSKLLEQLAELEHQQWMNWAQSLLQEETISAKTTKRWQSYFVPYEDLPEDIKELDRNYTRKALEIIKNTTL